MTRPGLPHRAAPTARFAESDSRASGIRLVRRHTWSSPALCGLACAAALTLAVGCQLPKSNQQKATESAERRWNDVRSKVKAQLASDRLARGNVEDAANEIRSARRLDPDNLELAVLQARVDLAGGRTAEAQKLLDSVASKGDRSTPAIRAEVAHLRGIIAQQRQRWEEALGHYRTAAALNPRELAYLLAIVETLQQLGRAEEARTLLLSQEQDFGYEPGYQSMLAECHELAGNWREAAAAWRRVAEGPVARKNSAAADEIAERLALALFRSGQAAEARPLLSELAAKQGEKASANLRLALADTLLDARDARAARDQLTLVVQADAYNAAAWRRLAQCHAQLGEFEPAMSAAQRALATDDADPATLELAAAISFRAGNVDQARRYAERLVRCSPEGAANPVAQVILSRSRGGADARQ